MVLCNYLQWIIDRQGIKNIILHSSSLISIMCRTFLAIKSNLFGPTFIIPDEDLLFEIETNWVPLWTSEVYTFMIREDLT